MTEKLISIASNLFSFQGTLLDNCQYSSGHLNITLTNNDNIKLNIMFDWIHSFRITDEGDLLKIQSVLKGSMVIGIYIVEDSFYLRWFNEQSENIHADEKIIHYVVVTQNEVIDILSSENPLLSLIE